MAKVIINDNRKIWYQITRNLNIVGFDEPFVDKSGETKYWIKVVDNGRTYTTNYDNTYDLYDFKIFNRSIEESVIKELYFTCDKVYESFKSMMTNTRVVYEIVDLYGERKVFAYSDWNPENIIIKCIKEMQSFAGFKSWREIDLKDEIMEKDDEILELKKEIKIQKKKASVLRKKIKELNNK